MADIVVTGPGSRDVTICGVSAVQIPKPGGGMKVFPLSGSIPAEDVLLLDANRDAQTVQSVEKVLLRAKDGGSVEFPKKPPKTTFNLTTTRSSQSCNIKITQTSMNGVTINWGDGSSETVQSSLTSTNYHTFAAVGTYEIAITAADGVSYSIDGSSLTGLTAVVFSENVTAIGANAFKSNSTLKRVTISPSITSVGKDAFISCSKLTGVYITDLRAWLGIQFANGYANPLCYHAQLNVNGSFVSALTIPGDISKVPDYAFYGIKKTNGTFTVTFETGVTEIGQGAFRECTGAFKFIFCNTITKIGSQAFFQAQLYNPILPDSVVYVEDSAFFESNITAITFGQNIVSIEQTCCAYCTSLRSVTVKALSPPTLAFNAFSSVSLNAIYVPAESVELYKRAANWSSFASYIQAIPAT